MSKERNFYNRPPEERRWFEEETWCDECSQADLGLVEPREYEEDGVVFIEGKCRNCGSRVVSEIVEQKLSSSRELHMRAK